MAKPISGTDVKAKKGERILLGPQPPFLSVTPASLQFKHIILDSHCFQKRWRCRSAGATLPFFSYRSAEWPHQQQWGGTDRQKGAPSQDVESRTLIVSLTLPVKEQWQEAEETAERLSEVSQEVISTLMKRKKRQRWRRRRRRTRTRKRRRRRRG